MYILLCCVDSKFVICVVLKNVAGIFFLDKIAKNGFLKKIHTRYTQSFDRNHDFRFVLTFGILIGASSFVVVLSIVDFIY